MTTQVHGFQTEVTKLLDLLANSLYSNKEVFLRELISNASDAIDKLHFMSLTNPDLIKDDTQFKIKIRADRESRTLTVSDNGLGMTLDEANANLGTIAKSGTEEFFKHLSGDAARDSQLIGQFGVGFYSSFIVADHVTVLSRSVNASEDQGVRWESNGLGSFESGNEPKAGRGTDIILHLKEGEDEFLDEWTLRSAITKYSDHISVPVELYVERTVPVEEKKDGDEEQEDKPQETKTEHVYEQINAAKSLWTRNPKDITKEEYDEFYRHLTSDYQEPLCHAHNKVEGETEYTSLLYVPRRKPWDIMNADREHGGIKLYVQRVFIMDKAEAFLPGYLRFVKGLLDTNALPLNVSRELLQESSVTRKLRKALTKRALSMIEKLSKNDDDYKIFCREFGRVLKEGVVEDRQNQETILKLLRFNSTTSSEADVSLDDYISRMKEGQDKIYYLIADSLENAKNASFLDLFKQKGIEVLLMTDRVDEWVMSHVDEYAQKKFEAVNEADLDWDKLEDSPKSEEEQKAQESEHEALIARFKEALGDKVKDVKVSRRLVDSASCVVSEEGKFMSPLMRRIFAEQSGMEMPDPAYVLEINPSHPLVQKAAATEGEDFKSYAQLILSQALLTDTGSLKDPYAFVKLIDSLLTK